MTHTTDRDTLRRLATERRIASQIVRDLIAAGFSLDVDDGDQGYLITNSTNPRAVIAQLFTMEDDRIFAHKDRQPHGWVYLVYGNDDGTTVLCDYTTNLEPYLVAAERLADSLER